MEGKKLALAVRHVHFEDCGTLEDVLVERGFTVRYLEAGRDALSDIDASKADLLISLGGPVAVYDSHRYPWIRDELNLIERSLDPVSCSAQSASWAPNSRWGDTARFWKSATEATYSCADAGSLILNATQNHF
jgi:hypothetical protein